MRLVPCAPIRGEKGASKGLQANATRTKYDARRDEDEGRARATCQNVHKGTKVLKQ